MRKLGNLYAYRVSLGRAHIFHYARNRGFLLLKVRKASRLYIRIAIRLGFGTFTSVRVRQELPKMKVYGIEIRQNKRNPQLEIAYRDSLGRWRAFHHGDTWGFPTRSSLGAFAPT